MKKLMVMLMVMAFFSSVAFASSDAVYERSRPHEVIGWSVQVEDDDIDLNTLELITELDSTYVQMSAESIIRAGTSDADDLGAVITLIGIDNSGNKVSESLTLTGDTLAPSSKTFRYLDQVEVDRECEGTLVVRRGTTFITSIPIGQIEAGMAQHFNGEYASYITGWSAITKEATGVKLELRSYPDDADCLDATDGFKILDRISITTHDTVSGNIVQPIKCSAGGWLAVYGEGLDNDQKVSIILQGYDSKN